MQVEICGISYILEKKNTSSQNLLAILFDIKRTTNRSLSFRSGCKSGVCGSCAVLVNGVEKLACKTTIKDTDKVTPLKNSEIVKDLIVNKSNQDMALITAKAHLQQKSKNPITSVDEKMIDIESNCILCNSCFSSCPVYAINPNFIAPFALMRNFRYVNDIKEDDIKSKLEAVQTNGIWDCTLCGNCNMVCPSHIDIKGDIEQLRNKSAQFGYNNPNMNMGFNTNLDFGFNPNGF